MIFIYNQKKKITIDLDSKSVECHDYTSKRSRI